MASLSELRQILQEDSGGKNLKSHMVELLMRILIEKPTNAFDSFELISADVKKNPLDPNPTKGQFVPISGEELGKKTKWTTKNNESLKIPEEEVDEPEVKYPDIIDEFNLLDWAGVNIGKGDLYRLYLSIRNLAQSSPAEVEKLRFVGKIYTRSSPYYVVEGVSPEEEEDIDELKQENKSGANKYCYFVTQRIDAADGWIKLPNVTSQQIVIARQFKRVLTGNLDATVPSYPPFPGTERNLLRTILALIVSSTSISPDGYFEVDEDTEPPSIKPAETEAINETFPKTSNDLKESDAWKHHEVELNAIGRITVMPEQLDENGDAIEPEEPIEVNSPLDNLKPEQWTFRVCPGGAGRAAGSTVVARSLLWPGAVAVASGRKFVNIYIGYGIPFSAVSYSPPLPKEVQTEFHPAEEDPIQLIEQNDLRVDPTPPVVEDEEQEED